MHREEILTHACKYSYVGSHISRHLAHRQFHLASGNMFQVKTRRVNCMRSFTQTVPRLSADWLVGELRTCTHTLVQLESN